MGPEGGSPALGVCCGILPATQTALDDGSMLSRNITNYRKRAFFGRGALLIQSPAHTDKS